MQVSHITDVLQTPALWRLAQFIRQHREQWPPAEETPDLERFEHELHDHVLAVERDVLVVLGRNNPSLYTVKGRPLYVHLNGLAIVLLK